MEKLDSIFEYYQGTKAYSLFLLNQFGDNQDGTCILKKKNYNAARVAFISIILLDIKEDILEDLGNSNFKSNIFNDELIKSVNLLATKDGDNYVINNYRFKDAPTLVAVLRNKLAHGNFTLDAEHSRVIIDIEGQKVILNIDKLALFVASALKNTYLQMKKDSYTKNILISNKIYANRKLPLSKEKLIELITTFNKISFTLENKVGGDIPKYILEEADASIYAYNKTGDIKYINHFNNSYEDYKLNSTREKIKYDKQSFDYIVDNVLKQTEKNNLSYDAQVEVSKPLLDKKFLKKEKIDERMGAFKNLILLDAAYKINSIDQNKIGKYISTYYTPDTYFSINNDSLASSALAMFQALFSYSNDDLYNDSLEYENNYNSGLDYSKLDLSKIKISYIEPDNKIISTLNEKKVAREKGILELQGSINKKMTNLNNVKAKGNITAIENIEKSLIESNENLSNLQNDLNNINQKISNITMYQLNNKLHLTNKAIITGIRNSIAHGHYKFVYSNDYSDVKIVFNDIYEGKITFSAEVNIIDFIELLYENDHVIIDFVENNIERTRQGKSI